MSAPGDREFPPSTWGAAFLVTWTGGISALCVLLGLGTALRLTTGEFLATGTGFCVVVFALAAVSGCYAVQLLRDWKVPVLVIDAAGIHAPRKAMFVPWHNIATVRALNAHEGTVLQLTPGNAATERWWQRWNGSTDLDVGMAKERHAVIVDAIRAHPNYRGS